MEVRGEIANLAKDAQKDAAPQGFAAVSENCISKP